MSELRLLLVEDDVDLGDTLQEILIDGNHAVDLVEDAETAWEKIQTHEYNLIVLDIMLPGISGLELCQRLRSHQYYIPIILLTALDTNSNKVAGLDAGADDYLVKPFDPSELLARIRAVLRRIQYDAQSKQTLPEKQFPLDDRILVWEELKLDPDMYEVSYKGEVLHLTPKEQDILKLFLHNGRRATRRQEILQTVWSEDKKPSEDALNATVKSLRNKLKKAGVPSDMIETVHGIGYRIKQLG